MSSHHFVKEGQEPALLIIDPMDHALAEPLLEWAPLVIVSQKALDEVLLWGIKIDVVIASQPDENLKDKLFSQAPVKIITVNDDNSFVETGLFLLLSMKQEAVSVFIKDPSVLLNSLNHFQDKLAINLLSKSVKWSSIRSAYYKKWLPAGSKLIFHGLSKEPTEKNLDRLDSAFQVIQEGFIEIHNSSPFWVGEVHENNSASH